MKRTSFALAPIGAAAAFLIGCGAQRQTPGDGAQAPQYTVGICQLMRHEALDAATAGFTDALNEALPGKVTIREKIAGEASACPTVINGFVSSGVDLILANGTPSLTAAASATDTIPILGTAVTAYGVALDLDAFDGTVGGNISGTSDLADLSAQAAMISEWFPETKTVGLLFCSGEPNSRYQIEEVAGYLAQSGIDTREFAFTDSNDVTSVTQAACEYADVIYIPTDNIAAANTEAIANVVLPEQVPVIAGEAGICRGCGVAALAISYYDLGRTTGEMAARILTGEADISALPIGYTDAAALYNAAVCEALGIADIPAGYAPLAEAADG